MRKIRTYFTELHSRKRSSEEGFTLLELIIVVAVVGILTAIAIPTYGAIQYNSKVAAVDATNKQAVGLLIGGYASGDCSTAEKWKDLYATDGVDYPTSVEVSAGAMVFSTTARIDEAGSDSAYLKTSIYPDGGEVAWLTSCTTP